MSQVSFTAMRGLVHPLVPGCPVPLIDQYLLSMAREFLRKTQAWKVELDPVDTVAGQTDYALTNTSAMTTSKGEIDAVLSVKLSKSLLRPGMDYNIGYDGSMLELVDAPPTAVVDAIEIIVAAIPASDATGIESHLYNRWGEYIAKGCAYRLQTIVGKPYYNADAAAFNRVEFMKGVEAARHRENQDRTQRPLQVQYPGFI